MIVAAKADGVRLTVETCPHYLTLAAEEIPDGHTEFKCCPPIRERANPELLWQALADGVIDFVVTDHSPSHAGSQAARRQATSAPPGAASPRCSWDCRRVDRRSADAATTSTG